MSGSVEDITTTTAHKIAIAKQKKETGDQVFKAGNAKEGKAYCDINCFDHSLKKPWYHIMGYFYLGESLVHSY